ncbi:hypothetical protein Y032_0082g1561 [Ancylostoma ceylanicum]|uniref:Uncharacterized protein n=1 Tax=Ancylostoma ceylanicum TaxID=53326 RepID=A0A016TRX8_9BILA|nr:hypothetical protein Y032_0082g1561 [Ancylostoma ceylanicum]
MRNIWLMNYNGGGGVLPRGTLPRSSGSLQKDAHEGHKEGSLADAPIWVRPSDCGVDEIWAQIYSPCTQ